MSKLLFFTLLFTHCDSIQETNNMVHIKQLTSENCIQKEEIVGYYHLMSDNTIPSIEILTIQSLFQGTKLITPILEGEIIHDTSYADQVNKELKKIFGGLFENATSSYLQCYKSFVSKETKAYYQSGGMSINWDEPDRAFYSLNLALDSCTLQVIGELGEFHCLSFAYSLDNKEIFDERGDLIYPSIDFIKAHLSKYIPKISLNELDNLSKNFQQNIFNIYYSNKYLSIKGGIREQGSDIALKDTKNKKKFYFYGIRINLKN